MRNTVDRYWKPAETAPHDIAVQVQVTDASGVLFVLPFPCKLTAEGWAKATTGTALAVRPTPWKLHVETLPGQASVGTQVAQNEHSHDGNGTGQATSAAPSDVASCCTLRSPRKKT
jgi:hypothetical protein